MSNWKKAAWALGVMMGLMGAAAAGLALWLSSPALKEKLEQKASESWGGKVSVGSMGLSVWPRAGVALKAVSVELGGRQNVSAQELGVEMDWMEAIKTKKWRPKRAWISGMELGEEKVAAIGKKIEELKKKKPKESGPSAAGEIDPMEWLPESVEAKKIGWRSKAERWEIQGKVGLGERGALERVELSVVKGRWSKAAVEAALRAPGLWDWKARALGGKAAGRLAIKKWGKGREIWWDADISRMRIEELLAKAPTPKEWSEASLSGEVSGSIKASAKGMEASKMIKEAIWQASLELSQGEMRGVDLEKAIRTVGTSKDGVTPIQRLSARVEGQGKAMRIKEARLTAGKDGKIKATARAKISESGELSGNMDAEAAGVGAPLVIGGTVEDPEVSLPASAKIGAGLGAVLIPGAGLGLGAAIGAKIGSWFGGSSEEPESGKK